MKKLLIITLLALKSLNSMAIGFPQNIYEQHRTLTKSSKEKTLIQEFEQLESTVAVNTVTLIDSTSQASIIELITKYIADFFSLIIANEKIIASENSFNKSKYLATPSIAFDRNKQIYTLENL